MSSEPAPSKSDLNGPQMESNHVDRDADIKAKREARQRKILENSKSRLEKLNGRIAQHADKSECKDGDIRTMSFTKTTTTTPKIIYPDPEIEREEDFVRLPRVSSSPLSPIQNVSTSTSVFRNDRLGGTGNFNNLSFDANFMNGLNADVLEMLNQLRQQIPNNGNLPNNGHQQQQQRRTQPPIDNSISAKVIKTKAHIIILSILTYILFVTGNEIFISYSVFLPLLLWEITEIVLLKKPYEESSGSIFGIVFLMAGINPVHLNAFKKWIAILNKIFKDVGVFMFFFALCHLIFLKFIHSEEIFNVDKTINNDYNTK